MNGPLGVFCATAPGMPIAAGTCRATPFTKIVRCAWMWKSVCSPALQLIPSTGCPLTADPVPASAVPLGTGTPSGPVWPAAGAACSVPSVLSDASFCAGVPLVPPLAVPPETPSVTPTAIAAAATTAPPPMASRVRRLRRASAFLAASIAAFLLSRELLPDTATAFIYGLRT